MPYPTQPSLTVQAHNGEVLCLDWNKWQRGLIATGSVDRTIKIWDCRMIKNNTSTSSNGAECILQLPGHEYAVRKVQWSNYSGDLLASASYDMTCRMYGALPCLECLANLFRRWSTKPPPGRTNLLTIYDKHTEFVSGCAWSLFSPSIITSCGWDCRTNVWSSHQVL